MTRLLSLLLLLVATRSYAQETDTTKYSEVRNLVAFYEYMLNTVGSKDAYTRDKEVIIKESYKKIFKDDQVQIEDDLLENRTVITNKDVPAYLRDVDFFFEDITFDFENIQITTDKLPGGESFFIAEFENNIDATTLEGEPYKKTGKRYIEVNIDNASNDLKIVSVYSTKMSREKELKNWWNSLSYGWKTIFREQVVFDSINNEALLKMASIDSLDLSNNQMVLDLAPLSALKDLIHLDISDTRIDDLNPIRYAARLRSLKANNTLISDIYSLQYFEGLTVLEIADTQVSDITVFTKTKTLEQLNISNIKPISFEALSHLKKLKELNISGTGIQSLAVLGKIGILQLDVSQNPLSTTAYFTNIPELKSLDLSETEITDLKGFKGHPTIESIAINKTAVSDLSPLKGNTAIKKIYADYTGIEKKQAATFMTENRGVLVITNSEELESWWSRMSPAWKQALAKNVGFTPNGKEDLVKLINVDSLNLANQNLLDPSPLKSFERLSYLSIDRNQFSDLTSISELESLRELSMNGVPARNFYPVAQLKNLEVLSAKNTALASLEPCLSLKKLTLVNVENTKITEEEVKSMLNVNPSTVVVFDTEKYSQWWNELDQDWKKAFFLKNPDAYTLHKLVESESITVSELPINSLAPLAVFINLKEVTLESVGVRSLSELSIHTNLKSITCKNGPLQSLEGLAGLRQLEKLDVSNTAIADLRPIENLYSLRILNCSGTALKKLKGISSLVNLEQINVSNTLVWKLTRLYELKKVNKLICYNTRLRQSDIDDFKAVFPDCDINFY